MGPFNVFKNHKYFLHFWVEKIPDLAPNSGSLGASVALFKVPHPMHHEKLGKVSDFGDSKLNIERTILEKAFNVGELLKLSPSSVNNRVNGFCNYGNIFLTRSFSPDN